MTQQFEKNLQFFKEEVVKQFNDSSNISYYYLDENLDTTGKDSARYTITNYAHAFDLQTGKFIKENNGENGYMYWNIAGRPVFIHQKIGELFCEKPRTRERLVVDHKDGCKTNNIADNLEWKTYSENARAQDVQERRARSLQRTNNMKEVLSANDGMNKVIKKQEEIISELEIENAKLKYELKNLSERYSEEITDEVKRLKEEKDSMHEIIKLYERKINRIERNIEREVEREKETNILREEYRKYFGIV